MIKIAMTSYGLMLHKSIKYHYSQMIMQKIHLLLRNKIDNIFSANVIY